MGTSTPIPFEYKGFVQKKDPAQLGPGEYYQAENISAQQEGALTARTGHQELTPDALASPCVSISKLNLGGADADNPRYLGSGTEIYRTDSTYAETSVYTGLTASQRWSAIQYNAGTSGTPSLYVSTKTAAIRDNGTYTTLQKWGIDPPPIPVTATVQTPTLEYLAISGGAPGFTTRFIPGTNSNGSGLKTVSAFGTGPGYVQITPTAGGSIQGVNGIYVGMILSILDGTGGNEQIIVLAVDAVSFYAVTVLSHIAANVTLGWNQETFSTVHGTALYAYNGFTLDASFNGTPDNGYETDDDFHIALLSTDVINVTQIEIRIVPNYSGSAGSATDYYTHSIVPSSVMSAGSATSPAWLELNIPKNVFTLVGNAGAGAFTWKNINEIDVIATANSTGAGQTVGVSSIYFIGGGGLNSSAAGTTLYDWLYTYRSPNTQSEGNPCPAMISANLPPPVTNSKMTLTLTGTVQAATQANGIADISGPGSINVYRRGGTFSDGFYRHVGYVANPGSGATVQFIDNASDASLDTAATLEFDNDPPVPSNLPVALTANILHFQSSGGGTDYATSSQANGGAAANLTTNATTRLVLSGLPASFTASTIASTITVGSTVQIGFGNTFELCIISSVGYGTGTDTTSAWLEVYLQYNHNTTANDSSETIECDTILRGRCDLVHQDFDCLFLAGDDNNPATLYQSKVGRPESFPVVNLENQFAQQINVGSPSNPINGISSIGPGELVCLNLDNLFIIQVWAGQMQQPIKAPASRGLYSKWCWCLGDNRIWYLAYDGIYLWGGGESQKVSEQIDYLFKKQTVNGIAPIDYTQAATFSFAYAENSLYVVVIDTNGIYHRLRFESLYNRWTIETIYAAATGASAFTIDALFTEPDTGNFLVAITATGAQSYLWLADFYSTTDGWVTLPTDGIEIQYTIWRYWPIADPSADYQINEVMLEMLNPADAVTMDLLYNYATAPTNTISVAVGQLPARGRLFSTVNSADSGIVQYSIGLKLTGATGTGVPTTFYTWQWRNFEWTGSPDGLPQEFGWLDVEANTNGVSVPFQLQLDGASVYTFPISGTFFSRASTVVLPQNLTGKQWRILPSAGYSGTLQVYKITPHDYPWSDSGYGCPKTFGWLSIEVNTNGVAVPMQLQIDGTTQTYNFTVTGTYFNRSNTITLPSNLTGVMWRIVPLTAGYTGLIQIFSVAPRFEKLPCSITHWDSLYQIYGSAGWKLAWQIWLDYQSTVPLIFSVYRDGNVLFYQATVPAFPQRDVARFYLPPINIPAGGTAPQLNKSQGYRFTLDSSDGVTTYQMYRDGSRVETHNLDGDQRSGFEEHVIWTLEPVAA